MDMAELCNFIMNFVQKFGVVALPLNKLKEDWRVVILVIYPLSEATGHGHIPAT